MGYKNISIPSFMGNNSADMQKTYQQYEITQIEFDRLRPNPLNAQTYDPIDPDTLDALYDNIREVGLQQPLLVAPAAGHTYTIISGHTRYTCIARIREEDPMRFMRVPCRVTEPLDPAMEKIMLVTNNIQRIKSSADIAREIQVVQGAVDDMIARGDIPPRDAKTYLARMMNISYNTLSRYERIEEKLDPALKDKFYQGGMNVLTADAIAALPINQQQQVLDQLGDETKITTKMVKDVTEKKKRKVQTVSLTFAYDELSPFLDPTVGKKELKKQLMDLLRKVPQ